MNIQETESRIFKPCTVLEDPHRPSLMMTAQVLQNTVREDWLLLGTCMDLRRIARTLARHLSQASIRSVTYQTAL